MHRTNHNVLLSVLFSDCIISKFLRSPPWPGYPLRIIRVKMTMDSSVCRNHNPIFSSFKTYHTTCNNSNMTWSKNFLPFWSTWVHAKCFVGYATLLEHLGPRQVFCEIRFERSLVLCVVFSRLLFVLSPFLFGHCIICRSIYSFWLAFAIFKLVL